LAFKNVSGTDQSDGAIGDRRMRLWRLLVEVEIQNATLRGAITVYASKQESAEKLATISFIDNLRRIGIWAGITNDEEPFEVETDKKDGKGKPIVKTEMQPVTKYMAPYYNHVKIIEVLELNDAYALTYPPDELEHAIKTRQALSEDSQPKRRTTNEVALAKREQKQKTLVKKEQKQEKVVAKETNKVDKQEMLKRVCVYFCSDTPKKIKDAAVELDIQYQKVRYSLFLIRDNGHNEQKYKLVETEIDGSKAFQLVKE
jgi:hypothetical protein